MGKSKKTSEAEAKQNKRVKKSVSQEPFIDSNDSFQAPLSPAAVIPVATEPKANKRRSKRRRAPSSQGRDTVSLNDEHTAENRRSHSHRSAQKVASASTDYPHDEEHSVEPSEGHPASHASPNPPLPSHAYVSTPPLRGIVSPGVVPCSCGANSQRRHSPVPRTSPLLPAPMAPTQLLKPLTLQELETRTVPRDFSPQPQCGSSGEPTQRCPSLEKCDPQPAFSPPKEESGDYYSTLLYLGEDRSGFRNRGNDCYACSVLTALLRSKVFAENLQLVVECIENLSKRKIDRIEGEAICHITPQFGNLLASSAADLGADSPHTALEESTPRKPGEKYPIHRALKTFRVELQTRHSLVVCARKLKDGWEQNISLNKLRLLTANCVKELEAVLKQIRLDHSESEDSSDLSVEISSRHEAFSDFAETKSGETSTKLFAYLISLAKKSAFYGYTQGISMKVLSECLPEESIFFAGFQEDAHEFLIYFLDSLEKEASNLLKECSEELHSQPLVPRGLKSSASVGPRQPFLQNLWINEVVQGTLLNVVRCLNPTCGHEIVTEERFVNLTLSLPPVQALSGSPVTVDQLLQDTLKYENLHDYVCDKCRSSSQQYQAGCFYGVPPPLLILQVKRFDTFFDAVSCTVEIKKNSQPVILSPELNIWTMSDKRIDCGSEPFHYLLAEEKCLHPAIHEAEKKCGAEKEGNIQASLVSYQLQAVVQHHGITLEHGHYTCVFRENVEDDSGAPRTVWKRADDNHISSLSLGEEENGELWSVYRDCYLLFYERVAMEESHCPVNRIMPRIPPSMPV